MDDCHTRRLGVADASAIRRFLGGAGIRSLIVTAGLAAPASPWRIAKFGLSAVVFEVLIPLPGMRDFVIVFVHRQHGGLDRGRFERTVLSSRLTASSRLKPPNVMQGGSPLSNALLWHTYRSTSGPPPV
jgi:hypothetical protein